MNNADCCAVVVSPGTVSDQLCNLLMAEISVVTCDVTAICNEQHFNAQYIFYEYAGFELKSFLELKTAVERYRTATFVVVIPADDEACISMLKMLHISECLIAPGINAEAIRRILSSNPSTILNFEDKIGLIEYISDAFIAADSNWTIKYINKAAEDLYKIRREDVLHKNAWEIFPKTAGSFFYNVYTRCLRDKVTIKASGVSPSSGRWLETTAYPTNDGIAVCFKDNQDREDLQNEMLRIKTNLQKLIDNVGNIIWSVDRELKVIICNDAYNRFVYEKVGIMPTEGTFVLYNTFDEQFYELRRSQYLRALDGETFTSVDKVIIKGVVHFIETSFAPIVDEDGSVTGVCCHSNDLTEQVMRMKMIEDQNKTLREIAFMQSHQVRGPLARILALSELFEYKADEMEDSQIIGHLKYAAGELDNVIRAIVDKTATISEIAN